MESASKNPDAEKAADMFFALQLEIARKADDLARTRQAASGLNVHCWMLAEAEVLARLKAASPFAAAVPA